MNNGKVIATNGKAATRVKLYHWWPGRQWEGPCPIPAHIIDGVQEKGSRYLTLAWADLGLRSVTATAECCPKDRPERKLGRRIALGRLAAELEWYRWRLVI